MSSPNAGFGKGLALFALALFSLHAQVITTGGGTVQANDACWTGGALFPVPVIPPGTLPGVIRYGAAMTCTIPIVTSIPWLVTFHFVEPCVAGGGCSSVVTSGQRLFSVQINDTPALQDLDIFANAGALTPLQRSVLVWPSTSNTLRIVFTASVRTAVVSSIDYATVVLPQMWQALVRPAVLMAIDGQTNGPALYYLEYREPSFDCGSKRPPSSLAVESAAWDATVPGEVDPNTSLLIDCMHGGTELVKQ